MTKITKGMINFLERVSKREVFEAVSYRPKTGTRHRFVGGQVTAKEATRLGFIRPIGIPMLGRPAYAELTDAGLAALEENGK